MQNEMEYMKMAEKLMDETVNAANVAMAQSTVALDTMLQLQSDERIEKDKAFMEALDKLSERHADEKEKMRKHYQRIILAISLSLLILIGGLVGGMVYLFSNFDFAVATYQDVSVGNDGNSTIEDGIKIEHMPNMDK